MAHIEDVYLGRWTNPRTGQLAPRAAVDRLLIDDSLDGAEAELVASAGLTGDVTLVADPDTWDAMGMRVAGRLRRAGRAVTEVLLERHPHATIAAADALAKRLERAGSIVAVGSGTINDLTKFVTAKDGRAYCVFGTAASMDGYASTTASIELESGLKTSLPAHSPKGVFLDLSVLAAAPPRMNAAGFGDCLCTSVARIDWWMSHRLWGGFYDDAPYLIGEPDAGELDRRAAGVGAREHVATGWLTRALVLSGLGVGFTGVSNHGSMGEHQISHYIDCFAGARHPGTTHGEQVGLATLTMGRIQQWFLAQERPTTIRPTWIDQDDMARRMGPEIAAQCAAEYRKKALDDDGAARLNERLQAIWPELRAELSVWVDPVADMTARLSAAGGATTAAELGVPVDFYREAVRHGHEMRNRFSFADLACDAGLLDDFAAAEV
ncbi:MAG: iron-containing alcohol dehydrogenase [Pseudomonadota bacterium]